MAIHDSARIGNLERSLQEYIQNNLEGVTGFPTDFAADNIGWPGESFETGDKDYFLQVSPIRDSAGEYFAAAAGGVAGTFKRVTAFLNVFVKREYADQQDSTNLLVDGVDTVKGAFPGNLGITVKNYQGDGLTTLGKLWLRGREPNQPQDKAWLSGGWMLTFEWEETDTA